MNLPRALRLLPLLGALALPGCDAGQATGPIEDATSFSDEDRIALDVIADADAVQAALDLIEVPLRTAGRSGMAWTVPAGAQEDALLARERFQDALQAMRAGDSVQAVERAREARRLVARVMAQFRGAEAMAALIDRAECLAADVERQPQRYAHAVQLRAELSDLANRARQRLRFGDSAGAGELAVLGEQRHRQRQADPTTRPGGAEAAVELGGTAVDLATRLVSGAGGPSDEQTTLLAVAAGYVEASREALVAGDDTAAVHLSDLAQWTAMDAVVWPAGVSAEEAAALLELAQAQYAAAAATQPTGLAADLLEWASELIDFGEIAVSQVPPRGTGALWRAAVICTWIIG